MFSNIFIAELEYFPSIRRRTSKIKSPSRHRNQTSFKFSLFSSFLVHVASRRRHAQLTTNAANPAGITFSFSPFSSFPILSFSFSLFLFPSPFFLLLPPALCSRMPLPCAMRCAAAHPCAMPTRRGMLGAPLGLCPSCPVACTAAAINAGRVLHHGSRVVLPSVEAVDALCGGRRAQCTAEIFLPCEPPLAPYKSS